MTKANNNSYFSKPVFLRIFFFLTLTLYFSCSTTTTTSIQNFSQLKVGMTKDEVGQIFGPFVESPVVHPSASGNGKTNYIYGDAGYVWYDAADKVEGFAAYHDFTSSSSEYTKFVIKRASGYSLIELKNKKVYLTFSPFKELKSNEGNLVFLENKTNILNFLKSKGYTFVDNPNKATAVIIVKIGISDPNTTSEIISSPRYNLNYNPPQQSTTNFYGGYGNYLGSSRTTSGNPYGTYSTEYAGQDIQTISKTEYARTIELICLDPKKKDNNIFWVSSATSEGSSDDIRKVFPYIFYAASQTIEKSATYRDYELAIYHTGVRELVGLPVPRTTSIPTK